MNPSNSTDKHPSITSRTWSVRWQMLTASFAIPGSASCGEMLWWHNERSCTKILWTGWTIENKAILLLHRKRQSGTMAGRPSDDFCTPWLLSPCQIFWLLMIIRIPPVWLIFFAALIAFIPASTIREHSRLVGIYQDALHHWSQSSLLHTSIRKIVHQESEDVFDYLPSARLWPRGFGTFR